MAFIGIRYDDVKEYLKNCNTNRLFKVMYDIDEILNGRDKKKFAAMSKVSTKEHKQHA